MVTTQHGHPFYRQVFCIKRAIAPNLEFEHHITSKLSLEGYYPPQRPEGVLEHCNVAVSGKKEVYDQIIKIPV